MGYPTGSRTTKVYEDVQNNFIAGTPNANVKLRDVVSYDLTKLPATLAGGVNERQRNIVNCVGWKIWFEAVNLTIEPVTLNWAIVVGRDETVDFSTTDGATALANLLTTWYANPSNPSKAESWSTGIGNMEMFGLPLNPDNFVVLKHKRYIIGGQGAAGTVVNLTPNHNSIRCLKKFYRLNRQIRYANNTKQSSRNRVHLVWWFDTYGAPANTATSATNEIRCSQKVAYYFREPRT